MGGGCCGQVGGGCSWETGEVRLVADQPGR